MYLWRLSHSRSPSPTWMSSLKYYLCCYSVQRDLRELGFAVWLLERNPFFKQYMPIFINLTHNEFLSNKVFHSFPIFILAFFRFPSISKPSDIIGKCQYWLKLIIFGKIGIYFYNLMPPKKQEKKEIVQAFQPSKFWKHLQHEPETLDKATAFLTNFEKELIELINQEKSLEENYEVLCEKIGVAIHPALSKESKEKSNFPQLRNNDYGDRFLRLLNYKIDAVSLKLLTFLITHFKVTSLKFSRNDIDLEAEDLKKFLEKQNNSTLLFLEWNPLENHPLRNDIFLSTVRPRLEHLILREDNLGNDLARQLLKKIKSTPELCLKTLDLTGNNLTTEMTEEICNFIEESKNIQCLGLSKNNLVGKKFLVKLFGSIGEIPLSEEEFAAHEEAVKARDEVVERNKKKKKGAADEPVPFVFDVKQTENGRFYVKNTSLTNLNLAKIGYGDTSAPLFENFAKGPGSKLQIFLDGNKFTKKSKDRLKACSNLLI